MPVCQGKLKGKTFRFKMKNPFKRLIFGLAAGFFIASLLSFLIPAKAFAFVTTLQDRSISIGSSNGGANTSHSFSFHWPVVVNNIGSVAFEYCDDPIDEIACVAPPGADVSGAVLDSQTGETGFTIASASTNRVVIGRPPADVGTQQNTYSFSNLINPSNIGPFYVRISAYTTSDGSGSYVSFNSVAASIDTAININAEVPPILYFCSAVAIPTDCSDANGVFIDFGDLLSTATSSGTSQFMVGTNAPNGYNVTANGFTMTSGTNQISPIAPFGFSQAGFSQFGLNLRANLSPPVGADMAGGSGAVAPNYNSPNLFRYSDGDVVASAPGPTELALYTVSYVVNINSAQPAGVYNTTITYVCTAGF
jgi:hypothetical protein